ncbi:hypothetical protein ACYOEI_11300 [Singulisphaera rosea]
MHHGAIPALTIMLVAASLPPVVFGGDLTLPDSEWGKRKAPMLLLSRQDIRTAIGLDAEKSVEAEAASRMFFLRAKKLFGLQGEKVFAEQRLLNEEQGLWLKSRLTDAQRTRLLQIDLQWEGPSALVSRRGLADGLGLNAEQRTILVREVNQFVAKHKSGPVPANDSLVLSRNMMAVLSEPQREQWEALLGDPFTIRRVANGSTPLTGVGNGAPIQRR